MVEDVAELLDLAALQALESAKESPGQADRVGHVAEHELDGLEAGVQLAVKLLPIAAGGEAQCFIDTVGPLDAGADRHELDVALKHLEVAGHAGDAAAAVMLSFGDHPLEGLQPA